MSPKLLDPYSPILIVGAGTWGASSALHLARRNYQNVTVFDPYPHPSAISAGNDVNKIVELGLSPQEKDEDYVNHTLTAALTKGWLEDPVFKPYYHDTGLVSAAHSPAGLAHVEEHEISRSREGYTLVDNAAGFRSTMPKGVLTGQFPGWKGYWKKTGGGWCHARKALLSAIKEAQRLGVNFITGSPEGAVTHLLYNNDDVVGVATADGKHHRGVIVILAAGANSEQLFDFKNQLRPTAWTLAHIKMTEEEARLYKDLPVLFNAEQGFFMEPDEDNHELKLCDEHPGYCNWQISSGDTTLRQSIPFSKHQIPKESEVRVRDLLRDTMPQLAERPFSFARICWCADTPDRYFLIDYHPDHPSLLLAVGGSGHGFAHIPAVGGFIVDAMEGKLEDRLAKAFRWRPETAVDRDWEDTQNRYGGSYKMMDFQTVTDWTDISPSQ